MNTFQLRVLAVTAAAVFMASGAPLCAVDIRIGDTPARRLAKGMTIPGKGVAGQCLPYAQALHARFCAGGIRSKILIYHYEGMSSPATNGTCGASRAHAVVAYDDDGRIYIMDNQRWLPMWVHGGSATAMTQQFSGLGVKGDEARFMAGGRPRTPAMPEVPPMTFTTLR